MVVFKESLYTPRAGGRAGYSVQKTLLSPRGETIIPAQQYIQKVVASGMMVPGTGLIVPGTGIEGSGLSTLNRLELRNKLIPQLRKLYGTGLILPGTNVYGVQGSGAKEDIAKFFKKIAKSDTVKALSKAGRKILTPTVKKIIPFLIDSTTTALKETPLAPAATLLEAATDKLLDYSDKGIDKLNKMAEKKGYGNKKMKNKYLLSTLPGNASSRSGKGYSSDNFKLTQANFGKIASANKALDQRALRLYNDVAISAPIKGTGLLPL